MTRHALILKDKQLQQHPHFYGTVHLLCYGKVKHSWLMFLWKKSFTLLCNVTIRTCSCHQQKISKPEAIFRCADLTVDQKVNQWRSEGQHTSTSIIRALQGAATELEMSHILYVFLLFCMVNTVNLPVCFSDMLPFTGDCNFTLRIKR